MTTASDTKLDVEGWLLSLLRKQRQIRAEASPTPECVTEAFLASYARHPDRMSLSDPRVKHVIDCDHCLPKLFDLRSQNAANSRSTIHYGLIAAACTACLLVGFLLAQIAPWRAARPKSMAVASPLSLDLRSHGTYRGSAQEDQTPLLLPPACIDLTLILPPFSEPGLYSISIARDREGHQSVAYARAIAVVENQQTRLTVPLDLSAASPGDYVLSTEHDGDGGAYYYSLRIH
jgi:hypothetical protein